MNDLAAQGFTPLRRSSIKRLIVSIQGHEKTGKTHFALTAPGPIAYFGLDTGDEGVVEKFLDEGKIILSPDDVIRVPDDPEVSEPEQSIKIDAEGAWDMMKKCYKAALESAYIRTMVIDTATEMWELIRLARFGKLSQVSPYQYGPVNAEMRGLIRLAFDSDKNVILIHKVKPVYVNDKRTADYERAGFGDTGYLVQANLRMDYDKVGKKFSVDIINARQNMMMAGDTMYGPMCCFPMVASMILDTDLEAWE